MTRIVLIDDYTILRDGIRALLLAEADLEVGEASYGAEVLAIHPRKNYVAWMLEACALGYVLNNLTIGEITYAIRTVTTGPVSMHRGWPQYAP